MSEVGNAFGLEEAKEQVGDKQEVEHVEDAG